MVLILGLRVSFLGWLLPSLFIKTMMASVAAIMPLQSNSQSLLLPSQNAAMPPESGRVGSLGQWGSAQHLSPQSHRAEQVLQPRGPQWLPCLPAPPGPTHCSCQQQHRKGRGGNELQQKKRITPLGAQVVCGWPAGSPASSRMAARESFLKSSAEQSE